MKYLFWFATLKMGKTPDLVTENNKEGLNERLNPSVMLGPNISWLLSMFRTTARLYLFLCAKCSSKDSLQINKLVEVESLREFQVEQKLTWKLRL